MPRYADDMILTWLETHTPKPEGYPARLFTWLALRRILSSRRPTDAELGPALVYEGEGRS